MTRKEGRTDIQAKGGSRTDNRDAITETEGGRRE